jgi:hypothetical protein
MQHALIDADILNYRIGFACNEESESVAITTMAHFLEDLLLLDLTKVQTWELHLTGKENFRNDIAVTAPYKGNRKSEKPVHYRLLREYLVDAWAATVSQGIEADDMLAIRATELGESSVIVSLDKDLDQVPGWHYNFSKKSLYHIDPAEGLLKFYKQMLTGDRVDNIVGVRGIGEVKAEKLLKDKNEQEMWETCVELLGYDRAVENGHLLYMLRHKDDTFTPPQELCTQTPCEV